MAKKKRQGHYCRICGEWKANEQFSGKGHAAHICRECASLPVSRRNELQRIGRVESIAAKFRLTKQEWDLLEKYAKSTTYPELKAYAAGVLEHRRDMREFGRPLIEECAYSDIEEELKEDIDDLLYHNILYFHEQSGAAPTARQLERIVKRLLKNYLTAFHLRIVPDEGWSQKCREVSEAVAADIAEMDFEPED